MIIIIKLLVYYCLKVAQTVDRCGAKCGDEAGAERRNNGGGDGAGADERNNGGSSAGRPGPGELHPSQSPPAALPATLQPQ